MSKKLPAELYDKVNYLCRCYMDHIGRFYAEYDFVPEVRILQAAIAALYEKAPIFHSVFTDNHIRPYWKVMDYTMDDVLTVLECDDLQGAAIAFLEQSVAMDDPSQMKIALIHNGKKSILAFCYNHMIIDGGAFKQFMTDLCNAYTHICKTGEKPTDFHTGTRKYSAVYDDFSPEMKRKAKLQLGKVSVREKRTLPFTPKDGSEKATIVHHSISANVFKAALAEAKKYGATANDLIAAAYVCAIYAMTGKADSAFHFSCAMDLRRYMKHPEAIGYTNHTAFMDCSVPHCGATALETLQAVSESTRKNKQDPFLGLHGIPLLNIAYATMVQLQAELVVKLFYKNSNISLSNVGAVDNNTYTLDGHVVTDVLAVGSAKEKPCSMLTAVTINGKLVLAVCVNGNAKDKAMLTEFFGFFEQFFRSMIPN